MAVKRGLRSAHQSRDFDPGERESLAGIQRPPYTLTRVHCAAAGTLRQRDTAAHGPRQPVALQQSTVVQMLPLLGDTGAVTEQRQQNTTTTKCTAVQCSFSEAIAKLSTVLMPACDLHCCCGQVVQGVFKSAVKNARIPELPV